MTNILTRRNTIRPDAIALWLRAGLGLVFVIGGWNKLSQLLDPARQDAIITTYMSAHGYINNFFAQYLFTGTFGNWLTPWVFLTSLSAFELASGLALAAGLLVRPFALVWGLLLWTFVMALPVITAPGVGVSVDTYTAPAMLVQIRDIGLSGLMFALFNLGSGAGSLDGKLFGTSVKVTNVQWDCLGLLVRLSVALPLIVGGLFSGLDDIQSFATSPWLILGLGLLLASGTGVHLAGTLVVAVMLWFIGTKLDFDITVIANLNSFKRELAFVAGGLALAYAGGGHKFTLGNAVATLRRQRTGLVDVRSPHATV